MKLKITKGYGWYFEDVGRTFDIVRSVLDDHPFAYVVNNPDDPDSKYYVRQGDFVLLDEAPRTTLGDLLRRSRTTCNSFFPMDSINIVPKDAHYSVGVIKMENSDNVCIVVMRDNVIVHLGQHKVQE